MFVHVAVNNSLDEMRFCSRCGFPLYGVGPAARQDGVLPDTPAEGG